MNVLARLFVTCVIVMILPLAAVAGFEVTPASASPTGTIDASPCLNFHNGPNGADTQIGCIPDGTTIAIACTATGNSVSGPYGSTTLWDETTWNAQTGFVSDAWVYTGTASAVAGTCTSTPAPTTTTTASPSTNFSYSIVLNGAGSYSGPGTNYDYQGSIASGTSIQLVCQAQGTLVGSSFPTTWWDLLSSGSWVSDYYTNTPVLDGRSITQCTASQMPAPPTISSGAPMPSYYTYSIVLAGASLYSGPGTNYTNQGGIANGTSVALVCQTQGTSVGSTDPTTWWDLLGTGNWVSDYYTNTPVLDGRSITQCTASQIPKAPTVSSTSTTGEGTSLPGTTSTPHTSSYSFCISDTGPLVLSFSIPIRPCMVVTDVYNGTSASSKSISVPTSKGTCPSKGAENDYQFEQLGCEVESTSRHAQGNSNVDVVKLLVIYEETLVIPYDGMSIPSLESDELTMDVTTSPTGVRKTSSSDVTTSYNIEGVLVCNSAPCPL